MQSEMPFYEGCEDALKASIQALGGAKAVGSRLWPDKSVEDARTLLLNCINPDRKEKFDYSQLIWIFREAKHVGHVAGFEWFARECEFEARPITKAEEVDRLTTVVEQSAKTLAAALASLERIRAA